MKQMKKEFDSIKLLYEEINFYSEMADKLLSIYEGNRLIALFWGYKYYPGDKWWKIGGKRPHFYIENKNHPVYGNRPHRTTVELMRFDSDWSWLMPVVAYINKTNNERSQLDFVFASETDKAILDIWNHLESPDLKIFDLFKVVVEYVKVVNEYDAKQNKK